MINKSHKLSFSDSSITSTRPLEIIFTDVWSSPILSTDHFKYYLVLVDHYTRYSWLYPLKQKSLLFFFFFFLKQKSQVKETFVAYKELVENRFQTRIGTLFLDNGGEFIALISYLQQHGISHLTSPPHTPEHNGVAER